MFERKLCDLFESFGYREYKTSRFESYDLYAGNRDFLKNDRIAAFTDLDGSLKALKPDVTLSIIKASESAPEKLYYCESVYRPKDGTFAEIRQCGVEHVGRIDAAARAELTVLAARSLKALGGRYVLSVSFLDLIETLFSRFDLDQAAGDKVLSALSSKNKTALAGLRSAGMIGADSEEVFCALSDVFAPVTEAAEALGEIFAPDELREAVGFAGDLAACAGADADRIFLDFSIVNSMDYYNGLYLQGSVEGIPFPVLSGGEYDRLPERMGKKIGAVGFAVYLDTVESYLARRKSYAVDRVILYADDERAALRAAQAALTFRDRGQKVLLMAKKEYDAMKNRPVSRDVVTVVPGGGDD